MSGTCDTFHTRLTKSRPYSIIKAFKMYIKSFLFVKIGVPKGHLIDSC